MRGEPDILAAAQAHDWQGALPEAIVAYETALVHTVLSDPRVPVARARLETLRQLQLAEVPLRAALHEGAALDAAGKYQVAAEKYRLAVTLHAQFASTPKWQQHSPTRLRSWDRMHAKYAQRLGELVSHSQQGTALSSGVTPAAREVWSKFDEAERRNKAACAARDAGRYAEAYRLFRETGSLFMGIKRGDFFTGKDRQLIVSHLVHVTMEMERMQVAAIAARAAARAAKRAPPPLPPRPSRDTPLSAEEAANEGAEELTAAEVAAAQERDEVEKSRARRLRPQSVELVEALVPSSKRDHVVLEIMSKEQSFLKSLETLETFVIEPLAAPDAELTALLAEAEIGDAELRTMFAIGASPDISTIIHVAKVRESASRLPLHFMRILLTIWTRSR